MKTIWSLLAVSYLWIFPEMNFLHTLIYFKSCHHKFWWQNGIDKVFCIVCHYLDLSEHYQCRRNWWGSWVIDPTPYPKILGNKFTLFQPWERGSDYANHINYYLSPGFSDLPTALNLYVSSIWQFSHSVDYFWLTTLNFHSDFINRQ